MPAAANAPMVLAIAAMAALTFAVWVRLMVIRVAEMRGRSIDPQSIAGSAAKAAMMQDTRASDNFVNLFEVPVLFYVAALLAIQLDAVTTMPVALAWTYVVLRVVHSLIQCTYNKVMHRFPVYALSNVVAMALFACVLCAGLY